MKLINRLFIKGLIVVLPITTSIYIIFLLASKAEAFFGGLIKGIIGETLYIPGVGILFTFLAIVSIGLLLSNLVTAKVINWSVKSFEKVPLIKAIYSPVKDLISLFAGGNSSERSMQKVVMLKLPGGMETIGLVTREEFSDFPKNVISEDKVAVYIPMSYMLGGFTMIVSKSDMTPLDMPVEKALKLALTGWIQSENHHD